MKKECRKKKAGGWIKHITVHAKKSKRIISSSTEQHWEKVQAMQNNLVPSTSSSFWLVYRENSTVQYCRFSQAARKNWRYVRTRETRAQCKTQLGRNVLSANWDAGSLSAQEPGGACEKLPKYVVGRARESTGAGEYDVLTSAVVMNIQSRGFQLKFRSHMFQLAHQMLHHRAKYLPAVLAGW